MSDIPHAVLSEHFQELMEGRRLKTAVFLTYTFDPAFFEQEVLPVFLDIPVSHATPIRLVQLEDALRDVPGNLAVYYDANGLCIDSGSAKLDVRRIPVRHHTGIFHPKNVFLIVEDVEPDEDGYRWQTLIVASLSANLTRAGWWENVEACHVEEIPEGDKTRLRDDLISFLESLRRKAGANDHEAIREVLSFLRRTESRQHKSTAGQLHTHFYAGREALVDFLSETAGDLLYGSYLEVISPYFDATSQCAPLEKMIERFAPKQVRVFLPRSAAGEGLCSSEFYEAVRALPGVEWGHLPKDVLSLGRSDKAGERFVHAKAYRFFTQNPKRELLFVGSLNLTSPAHRTGGNVETGFLVDQIPPRRPDFWLSPEKKKLAEFQSPSDSESDAAPSGTRLNLRYHWDRSLAEVYWDDPGSSPELRLEARGIPLGSVPPLTSRVWTELSAELAGRIAELLGETSLLNVYGEGDEPRLLLIQEEGMSHKPSLLFHLSAADILRYWSLLTPAQRAAFLEARAPEIALLGQGADLVARARIVLKEDTLFDRFAGFFHAFACAERAVREALDYGREKEPDHLLFGRKYDSLGNLLDRVASENDKADDVDRYVLLMCARQMCWEIARDYPDYWQKRAEDAKALDRRLTDLGNIRQRFLAQQGPELGDFLDWFDHWFLARATPVEEVGA